MDNLPGFVKDHIEYLERLDLDKRSLEEIKMMLLVKISLKSRILKCLNL